MEIKRRLTFIACALISLHISAGSSLAVNQPKTEVLPLEVVPSNKVILKNVRIINDKGCVVVKGSVKPQRKIGPGIHGHVDIELLDIEGQIVDTADVYHTPRYLKTKGNRVSYFTFSLGEVIQNIHQVRVSYHYTRNTKKSSCNHKH